MYKAVERVTWGILARGGWPEAKTPHSSSESLFPPILPPWFKPYYICARTPYPPVDPQKDWRPSPSTPLLRTCPSLPSSSGQRPVAARLLARMFWCLSPASDIRCHADILSTWGRVAWLVQTGSAILPVFYRIAQHLFNAHATVNRKTVAVILDHVVKNP